MQFPMDSNSVLWHPGSLWSKPAIVCGAWDVGESLQDPQDKVEKYMKDDNQLSVLEIFL